ncbi:MAG: hypothetical protein MUF21_06240 [Gemmatimonadaceae bacterium]|nr:hypothetical protein [Gemmatimonadaceae bacterium]
MTTPAGDPGPVPAAVRAAYARLARPTTATDAVAFEASLAAAADPEASDDARAESVERLLALDGGREALAYLAAARRATAPGPAGETVRDAADPSARADDAAPLRIERGGARAAMLAGTRAPVRRVPRWALAAAGVAIVAGVTLTRLGRDGDIDVTRDGGSALATVSPRGELTGAPTRLVWRARPGRTRYTVELLGADDAPVFTQETNDTAVTIPAGLLSRGAYRWYVRARGLDGTDVRSPLQRFTIR